MSNTSLVSSALIAAKRDTDHVSCMRKSENHTHAPAADVTSSWESPRRTASRVVGATTALSHRYANRADVAAKSACLKPPPLKLKP